MILFVFQKQASTKVVEKVTQEIKTSIGAAEKEKKANYEFGGPIGVLFTILLMPVILYAINLACRNVSHFYNSITIQKRI